MLIIGINSSGYVTSAAVVLDGKLVFGCAEERLDRRKLSKYFPLKSIKTGLDYIGAKMSDVDHFAIGYNPGISVGSRTRTGFSEWPGYPGARFFSNPNYLLPQLENTDFKETQQLFHRMDGGLTSIRYVTHHLSHISNAFLLSQFPEAAIFSCDGYGERATTVWAKGDIGKGIDILQQIEFPHSIGSLYATITQFLGYTPDGDEWKVMGAAAYGDAKRYYDKLRLLINWDEQGRFELDLSYFNHFNFDISPLYRPKLEALLFPPRRPEEPLEQKHYDLAAGIQKLIEDYFSVALRWLHKETGCNSVCLTGGVAMNSVCNGIASLDSPFERVYVPFAPDDNGNSIGAALWVAWQEKELKSIDQVSTTPFLGRSYDDVVIQQMLDRYHLSYKYTATIATEVADLLASGKVVGWFQGRMEFGHRALGARSILADPRDPKMKDKINRAVKYRESYRPFAPSILEEEQTKYFAVNRFIPVPYMEKVLPIRKEMQALIPAVVHADGTGRLQTVSSADNPLYYSLIKAFSQRTGVPVVLNTSFNVNGEPIVESPSDAIRTFFSSGLNALAIGSYLVQKS
jgi:carbamoyltransferase